jgi:hypothetical protein
MRAGLGIEARERGVEVIITCVTAAMTNDANVLIA